MPGMKYEAQNIKFYVEFTCRILLGDDADCACIVLMKKEWTLTLSPSGVAMEQFLVTVSIHF